MASLVATVMVGGVVLATTAVAPGGGGVPVDNSLTFGVGASRQRVVESSSYAVSDAYPATQASGNTSGAPDFVPVPTNAEDVSGGVCSWSTPIVDGTTAIQYGYAEGASCGSNSLSSFSTEGLLFAEDMTAPRPATAWGGNVWTFNAPSQACNSGQTVNMAGVSAATLDSTGGYLAIGVGCYLYWTSTANLQPASATEQASSSTGWSVAQISGNGGAKEDNEVGDSPVITAPISVRYSSAFGPTTESTPFACVGDDNQGMACAPLASYAGETAPAAFTWTVPVACKSTDPGDGAPITWIGGSGACQALDNGGYSMLTSSPAWDPEASVGGSSGAVVFGINDETGTAPGAIVELNPATGASTIIVLGAGYDGLTAAAAGVSSSIAVYDYGTGSPADGTMVVPDNWGDLYEVSPSGQVLASMTRSSIAQRSGCSASTADISNVAVGQYSVYAVENCLTSLWRFGVASLAPVGAYTLMRGESLASSAGDVCVTGYPSDLFSPTVVRNSDNAADAYLFVTSGTTSRDGCSGGSGLLYDVPIGSNVAGTGEVSPMSTTTGSPAFVSALPDAGANHDVLLWTNADGGGFDYWTPENYVSETLTTEVNGSTSPLTVAEGTPVTVTMDSSLPSLGQCDASTTIAPNMTCLDLRQAFEGTNGVLASDRSTWIPVAPYTITQQNAGQVYPLTGASWSTQVSFSTPGTYTLYAVLQNSTAYWPGGINSSQTVVQSPGVQVTVTCGTGCTTPPSTCTPSSDGWNGPANCLGPAPTPAASAQLGGALALEVGDQASNYSPVYDPNWTPTSGYPDPCVNYNTATCNSVFMGYQPDQYALFGQHLLVRVTPPAAVAQPPTLSSRPSTYTAGLCQVNLDPNGQNYVTLPQGIDEATGQLWPQEWDQLQASGNVYTGTVLVDWAWWPPLPPGTVTDPQAIVSHYQVFVSKWEYEEHTSPHYDATTGKTTYTYSWVPRCVAAGVEEGETNPATNAAEGGLVAVWGDRVVLLTPTTEELKWGLP